MSLKSKANLRKTTKGNLRESKKMGTNKSKKNSFRSNKNKGKNQKRLSKSKKRYSKSNQKGGKDPRLARERWLVKNSDPKMLTQTAWGNYSSMFSNIVKAALGKNMKDVSDFEVGLFDVSNYEERERKKYQGRTWYKFPVTKQGLKKCIWVLAPIEKLQPINENVSFQHFIDRPYTNYSKSDKGFERYLRETLGNQEILIRTPVQVRASGGDPNKYYIVKQIIFDQENNVGSIFSNEAYYNKNEERFENFPNPNEYRSFDDPTEIDILKRQLIESSS